jgi:hypothetical protein
MNGEQTQTEALSTDRSAEINGRDMAYPCNGPNAPAYGLTKRELFAAMAMQGMFTFSGPGVVFKEYAVDAVHAADALLKELAK